MRLLSFCALLAAILVCSSFQYTYNSWFSIDAGKTFFVEFPDSPAYRKLDGFDCYFSGDKKERMTIMYGTDTSVHIAELGGIEKLYDLYQESLLSENSSTKILASSSFYWFPGIPMVTREVHLQYPSGKDTVHKISRIVFLTHTLFIFTYEKNTPIISSDPQKDHFFNAVQLHRGFDPAEQGAKPKTTTFEKGKTRKTVRVIGYTVLGVFSVVVVFFGMRAYARR